jgi:hypothetical protein
MNFKVVLLVLAALILIALVTLIIVIAASSSDKNGGIKIVETRYQCSDGRFVSDMTKCPTVIDSATTSIRKPSGETLTSSTSTLCPCVEIPPSLTTLFTSSTTLWKGPPCVKNADCGDVYYGNLTCTSNNEVHKFVYTPTCKTRGDGAEHCYTIVSTEFIKDCSATDEICKKGVGCVKYEEE